MKNPITVHFGARVREHRARLEMPAAELAHEAGVALNTLYRLETGKTPHQFRLDTAAWVAKSLGVTLSELLPETF